MTCYTPKDTAVRLLREIFQCSAAVKLRLLCRKDKSGRRRQAAAQDSGHGSPTPSVTANQEEQRVDAIWDNLRHNFVPAALRALAPDAVEPELPTEEQCNVSGLGEGATSRTPTGWTALPLTRTKRGHPEAKQWLRLSSLMSGGWLCEQAACRDRNNLSQYPAVAHVTPLALRP